MAHELFAPAQLEDLPLTSDLPRTPAEPSPRSLLQNPLLEIYILMHISVPLRAHCAFVTLLEKTPRPPMAPCSPIRITEVEKQAPVARGTFAFLTLAD